MNSSNAASTMAWRRSAARSARLEAGFGDGRDAAAPLAAELAPGRAPPLFAGRCFFIGHIMTDQSVIINWNMDLCGAAGLKSAGTNIACNV
jgi:hypothetical protein